MVAWWITFGNPLANPYALESDWSGGHLLDVLFSSYHGLYFTAPVLILATLGWLVGLKRDSALFGGAVLALLGTAYSSSTRIGWWEGVSFGARYFIGLTPLFVMGFAQLVNDSRATLRAPRWLRQSLVLGAGLVCAVWTYGYFLQAFTFITSFSEYHPPQQWLAGQVVILQNLPSVLVAHWLVPRSPYLLEMLWLFAAISLLSARLVVPWLARVQFARSARLWAGLASVPVVFALVLVSTIPAGELHKQQLVESGYYQQNKARAEFDFEQFSNEFVERSRYDEATGQTRAALADMQRALVFWDTPTRQLVDAEAVSQFQPLQIQFGNELQLVGYRLAEAGEDRRASTRPIPLEGCAAFVATCSLKVHLLWRATHRLPEDYDVGVLLLDTSGQVVARTRPALGLDPFPTSWWLPRVLMSDDQEITLDGLPSPTLLRLRVEVFDAMANRRLAASANNGIIAELKRSPDTSGSGRQPVATFANEASLLAYDVIREASGASVALTWRAESVMGKDYTIFVHLLDAQNQMLAQSDGQPVAGLYPTHAWDPGEIIYDVHRVTMNADVLARLDHIAIGLYTLDDGKRLPISTGADAASFAVRAP
jgi:hypothetical protein